MASLHLWKRGSSEIEQFKTTVPHTNANRGLVSAPTGVVSSAAVRTRAGSWDSAKSGRLLCNTAPGILYGYAFWRHGLEAAVIAHTTSIALAITAIVLL